jgi:hypothetical protein
MSLLSSLTTDQSIAPEKDNLGGGSRVLDTGIYAFKVELAYIKTAASGAMALELRLKADAGELRQTLWMTSGKEKGGHNYYVDKSGAKQYLPGFSLANSLCLLTIGKEIAQLNPETKTVKLWSSEAKAEVPTQVPVLMDLIGQEIHASVFKQLEDKTVKTDAGTYVPSGETRETNELDKFFRSRDMMTVAEILANNARQQKGEAPVDATFHAQWLEKWASKVRDRTDKKAAGSAGKSGLPGAGGGSMFGAMAQAAKSNGAAGKPTSSLFG